MAEQDIIGPEGVVDPKSGASTSGGKFGSFWRSLRRGRAQSRLKEMYIGCMFEIAGLGVSERERGTERSDAPGHKKIRPIRGPEDRKTRGARKWLK